MEQSKSAIKYGIVIGSVLIGYFLIIRSLGLAEVYWLRLINGIILGYGIYYAIKKNKEYLNNHINYFDGIGLGIKSGLVATGIFVTFLAIYMYHIDTGFSERLMTKLGWNINNPEKILLVTIFMEGIASTVILSLTFMQLFKTSWNIEEK
ncbi:DUF4199 domain-containing protein [Pseudofulvibacter geojedonensis]|uniref:DUF4199 domain-containing protein n=1 Tax=Pseudofulvibacter geojedonensis TaxID=1123758 RepID=A0ABW3I2F8_9FLAO